MHTSLNESIGKEAFKDKKLQFLKLGSFSYNFLDPSPKMKFVKGKLTIVERGIGLANKQQKHMQVGYFRGAAVL